MAPLLVAPGGWTKRKTPHAANQYAHRQDSRLDPARDAPKIRAFFVHLQRARRDSGALLLEACEHTSRAARTAFRASVGARHAVPAVAAPEYFQSPATPSGVALYRAKGHAALENQQVPLSNGEILPIMGMAKEIKRGF